MSIEYKVALLANGRPKIAVRLLMVMTHEDAIELLFDRLRAIKHVWQRSGILTTDHAAHGNKHFCVFLKDNPSIVYFHTNCFDKCDTDNPFTSPCAETVSQQVNILRTSRKRFLLSKDEMIYNDSVHTWIIAHRWHRVRHFPSQWDQ